MHVLNFINVVCWCVCVLHLCHITVSLSPFPLLLPSQVHLGNQQTIVGLITFQTPVDFNFILYIVLPVLGGVLLCAVLLLVVGCCVCQRRVRKKTRLLDELQGELHQIEASVVSTVKTGEWRKFSDMIIVLNVVHEPL